jgi:DNA-binding GntR family transcriptional regulator
VEITVDVTSPVYPYRQIADQLRAKILSGEITDRLPSLWQLMDQIEPRPGYNTVRKAIAILKDEGLVVTAPGHGTFVRRGPE